MLKTTIFIIFFPLALFAHFTWKWWERQWKGNFLQKGIFLLLFPVYGTLFVILNITSS